MTVAFEFEEKKEEEENPGKVKVRFVCLFGICILETESNIQMLN